MFNYDPSHLRDRLSSSGYAHLKGVLSDAFVADLQAQLDRALAGDGSETTAWKIAHKKRQFVYSFPSDEAALEFRAGMAALTGLKEEAFTISERHIKLYSEDAAPYPAPHKDRSASQYSIGLPISIANGSTVAVFPDLDPGHNAEPKAVFLDAPTGKSFEEMYAGDDVDLLNEQPGDVVIFEGSALYHERLRAAGTAVLYIKINDRGDDPLGENIYDRIPQHA